MAEVRWTHDDQFVVSAGGGDLTLCVWRVGAAAVDELFGGVEVEESAGEESAPPRADDGNERSSSTDRIEFTGRVEAAQRIQGAWRRRVAQVELTSLGPSPMDRRLFMLASPRAA